MQSDRTVRIVVVLLAFGLPNCTTDDDEDVGADAGPDATVDVEPDVLASDATKPDVKQDTAVDAPADTAPPPDATQPDTAPPIPVAWVEIPAGKFTMGSPTSEPCRELVGGKETQHEVTLAHGFELQTNEVTQHQFQSLMGYNPSHFGPSNAGLNCGINCPVEMVNWHEAVAYCNALSQKDGKTPCYSCTGSGKDIACEEATAYSGQKVYDCPGFRLPTEAEWEYAYRAGKTTAYPNGINDGSKCISCSQKDVNADEIGWYCSNSDSTSHPVGQKQPNDWGLYDMAGNVWEWCHDWFQDDLGSADVSNPWGAAPGSARVLRSSAWSSNAGSLRAARRGGPPPTSRDNHVGFRCARTN